MGILTFKISIPKIKDTPDSVVIIPFSCSMSTGAERRLERETGYLPQSSAEVMNV
jgi:hypothetical protein